LNSFEQCGDDAAFITSFYNKAESLTEPVTYPVYHPQSHRISLDPSFSVQNACSRLKTIRRYRLNNIQNLITTQRAPHVTAHYLIQANWVKRMPNLALHLTLKRKVQNMNTTLDRDHLMRWLTAYHACPYATFFHSPAWYLSQQRLTNDLIHIFSLTVSGQQVLVPAALKRRFRGLSNEWHVGVASGYGGVLAEKPLAPDEQAYVLAHLIKTCTNVRFVSNPFEGEPLDAKGDNPAIQQHHDQTQVVRICTPEAQLKQMAPQRARQVRRSIEGPLRLSVVEAPSPNTVTQFLPLYQAHSAQWHFKRWIRDQIYFENLLDLAGGALTLFMVHHESVLAGFQLIAVKDTIASQLHFATHQDHHHLYPGARLTQAVLDWARSNQVTHLDFLSSGELDGVRRYKAAYGTEAKPFQVLSTQNWQSRALAWSARIAQNLATRNVVAKRSHSTQS
jgi:CelD/BcsL family acetyltransferase involved in cellulose biosynthesis